jgi:CCR4-NOT transcription complex subunit 1
VKDKKKFELFLNILKSLEIIKNNNFDLFFDFIFNKWDNEENQIDFLHYLISNPQTETFSFKNYKGKRTKQHFELNFSISKSSSSFLIEPWTCISLLEVLLKLSHGNNYVKVKELFDWPIQNIPETIALGLMQITKKPSDFLYDELIQEVLTLFLGNHMNSFSVIEEVWNANKELVINAIANMYNSSPDLMNLSRILDITQKLKESLLLLVTCSDYKFAVNLAILAVKRDFLHIEQWLKERIETVGDDFILALLDYIKENLISHCKTNTKNKESILEKSQLTFESLAVILENLTNAKHSTNSKVSLSTEDQVREIYKSIFDTFKELNLEPLNSKEIEETANAIFQSMFKGETKVSETIERLKLLKDSKSQKDREIYACMIHCLLDEYRFYHQYPEKQLNIVSTLFGQIINNKLIDGVIETIALKYILEGIKKGNGPLFIFGTTALQQFIDKLNNLPSYTSSLVETKQLKNDPILFESVLEKYSSIFVTDPAGNNMGGQNQGMNMNNNNLNNLINPQNMMPNLNMMKGVNPMNQNNDLRNIQLKNKMFTTQENGGPQPVIFDNDLSNQMGIKNNQRLINPDANNFNPLMYNMQNNNKSTGGTEQFYGVNNIGNNLSSNMPINTQLLQSSMGQNINNLMNNNISNININSNNNNIDTNAMFMGNNLNPIQNNAQNNLNNSLQNIQNQNNLLNNSSQLNNNNISLNDSLQNIDDQSPQKRPKLKREPSGNKSGSNVLSPGSTNNIANLNNDFGNINMPINNIKNIPGGNNNNGNYPLGGDSFGNELEHKIQASNSDILEQIQYKINQLNVNNLQEKAAEIAKLCNNDNILKMFSDYFIVNRISTEINNHDIYFDLINLIDNKESKDLINYQIADTLKYILRILNSKTLEEQKEKNLLKNLGNWLGKITLSRNKPILAKDLDFRELLQNSYENGKLVVIIPFITKILVHTHQTKVFNLKNPWLNSILSILNSIYSKPGLRQVIMHEIEQLFNKLGIKDLSKFPTSNFLDNKKPNSNSQDFNLNQMNFNNSVNNSNNYGHNNYENMNNTGSSTRIPRINNNNTLKIQDEQQLSKKDFLNKIMQCSYLAEMNKIFETRKIFQDKLIDKNEIIRMLYKVLNDSISNIIGPVIERAVNISLVTTKELVIKDFQFEPNENKFKVAAINSIKSLAGALALVTCKEPLRMSFTKKIKDYLADKKIDSETLDEVVKMKYTGDLLNLGCSHIYNYVQKKAAEKVLQDETIAKEIERRSAIDMNGNKMFNFDNNSNLMKIVNKLPDSLKPNIKGLTKDQLSIYDNYPKIYGESISNDNNQNNNNVIINNPSTISHITHLLKDVLEKPNSIKSLKNYELCMQNIQNTMINSQNNNNEFEEGSEELKLCEKSITDNKLKELNLPEHEETKLIFQMVSLSFRYAYNAFERQNKKLLNVYIAIIKGWIKSSTNVNIRKEITNKLMQSASSLMCFNINYHVVLINNNILDLDEYQNYIINYLEMPHLQKQCINLLTGLKKYKIYDPSNNNRFPKIHPFYLEESKCSKYFSIFGKTCKSPSDLNIITEQVINYKICNIKDQKTYALFNRMCYFAFNKIINTKYPIAKMEPSELAKNLNNFITSPFINNDEQLNVFIMLITELCVKRTPSSGDTDNYPDNEARCIYTLLMAVPNTLNKLKMFGNILNGIYKTFHFDYVKTTFNFNQRPYFKLFYSFISLLEKFPNDAKVFNSENTKIQYMNLIAEFLKNPSPSNYPGFALAWLELISCKPFISCFLDGSDLPSKERNSKVGLENYLYLIMDLFVFLKNCGSYTYNKYTSKIFIDNLYKYMFLLSNSYPEFISGYYYICMISLPPENIYMQLKNIILSTTPRNLENLKNLNFVDKDLEKEFNNNTFGNNAENFFDIKSILKQYQFLSLLEKYIQEQDPELIKSICDKLNKNKNKTFNFYVIYAIVIFWAENALKNYKNIKDPYCFFFQMILHMEIDNRDHLINSLLNELRYPSNQTLYFLLMITHILVKIHNEQIEEHIIMLLFERLLIKPIPWGIELLFQKLLKGEKYNLFNTNYIKNLNGGINFIKSLKDFVENKQFYKYTEYRKSMVNNNNNSLIANLKESIKKEKNEQNKKIEENGGVKNKKEENQ